MFSLSVIGPAYLALVRQGNQKLYRSSWKEIYISKAFLSNVGGGVILQICWDMINLVFIDKIYRRGNRPFLLS